MGGSAERAGVPTRVLAAGGQRTASARSRGCLAAWASVDVGDGGTEPAVFPVRGDDGAVSEQQLMNSSGKYQQC